MMLTLATWCRDFGHTVLVLAPLEEDQWLQEESARRGIDTYTFRRSGPLDIRCLHEITGELRRHRIELIHGHMFTGAYYGVAAARLLKIRSVVTFHGGAEQTDRFRRRVVIRWAIRNSDVATVVSEQMRQDIADALGPAFGRLEVIVNGMPTPHGDRQRLRDELMIGADERLVVAVGSCCVRKNHVALVHALAQLPPSVPWRLAVCGREDDATAEIMAAIAHYNLHNRVHLLGVRLDVGDVLSATDVFAMPSLWEGTPLALIEAMMGARPCVASAVGGIPDMIDDGVSGLLVNPTATTELVHALGTLIQNADGIATRLGSAAEIRARTGYGLDEMCTSYQAIYESVA